MGKRPRLCSDERRLEPRRPELFAIESSRFFRPFDSAGGNPWSGDQIRFLLYRLSIGRYPSPRPGLSPLPQESSDAGEEISRLDWHLQKSVRKGKGAANQGAVRLREESGFILREEWQVEEKKVARWVLKRRVRRLKAAPVEAHEDICGKRGTLFPRLFSDFAEEQHLGLFIPFFGYGEGVLFFEGPEGRPGFGPPDPVNGSVVKTQFG